MMKKDKLDTVLCVIGILIGIVELFLLLQFGVPGDNLKRISPRQDEQMLRKSNQERMKVRCFERIRY